MKNSESTVTIGMALTILHSLILTVGELQCLNLQYVTEGMWYTWVVPAAPPYNHVIDLNKRELTRNNLRNVFLLCNPFYWLEYPYRIPSVSFLPFYNFFFCCTFFNKMELWFSLLEVWELVVSENGIITWASSIERIGHGLRLLRVFLLSPTNLSALSSALSHGGYPGCIRLNFYTDFLSGSYCSFLVQIFSNSPRSVSGSKHNGDNRLDLALVYEVYLVFLIFTVLWKILWIAIIKREST